MLVTVLFRPAVRIWPHKGVWVRGLEEFFGMALVEGAQAAIEEAGDEVSNVPSEDTEAVHAWVLNRGNTFQAAVRDYLSKFDREVNPTVAAGRVGPKVSASVLSLGRVLDQVKQLKPKKRGRKRGLRVVRHKFGNVVGIKGSRMIRAVTHTNIARVAVLTLVTLGGGCGGGTTGTSSTGELRLSGYAQDSSGARLGNTAMLVRAASDDQELISSATDAQGDFGMALPGDQSSLLIEIDGKRSQPIARSFTGSSVLSTVVTSADSRELSTAGGFEIHIDPESLCGAVGTEDNELFIQGALTSPCAVKIKVSSSDYATSTFSAVLRARSGDDVVVIETSRPDSQGDISVDLSRATERGCSPYDIQISSKRDPRRVVVVPVR